MPDLVEQMYCSQQINIPTNLPFILKQYAKAAIRTQPQDLLFWSAAYFKAKADNLPPPVKERIEYPPIDTPSGLSPGFLKVLHNQLGGSDTVKMKILNEKWLGVCLKKEALINMVKLGRFSNNIPWLNFLAIAAGFLFKTNFLQNPPFLNKRSYFKVVGGYFINEHSMLSQTMILICEILTEEPDGGSAMIPVETFNSLYTYLARLSCGTITTIEQIPSESSVNESTGSDQKKLEDERSITDIKGDVTKRGSDVGLDSHAGLMVWPDIEPSEESTTHERSPRPRDEGATSEDGLMVVDDITKPPDTTQVIIKTPYPVDDRTQDLETPERTQDPNETQDISALKTPFSQAIQLVYVDSEEQASGEKRAEEGRNLEFWSADDSLAPNQANESSNAIGAETGEDAEGAVEEAGEDHEVHRNEELSNKIISESEEQSVIPSSNINIEESSKIEIEEQAGTSPSERNEEEPSKIVQADEEQPRTPPPKSNEEEPSKIGQVEEDQPRTPSPDQSHTSPPDQPATPPPDQSVTPPPDQPVTPPPDQSHTPPPDQPHSPPPDATFVHQEESEVEAIDGSVETPNQTFDGDTNKELGTDKVDTNESEVLAANTAGKGSVHSVHELEETKEFIPPFDSTHVGQDFQESKEIQLPESMADESQTSKSAVLGSRGSDISKEDQNKVENDFEKEISSLPSTQFLGVCTISGTRIGTGEFVEKEEKTIEEIKSVSSESKSFIILDEGPYWENVPGIGPVIPEEQIKTVTEYMKHWASKQEGMVMPRNLRHFLCPPLDHPDTFKSDLAN